MEPTETVYQNFRYFGFVVFADFDFTNAFHSFIREHLLQALGKWTNGPDIAAGERCSANTQGSEQLLQQLQATVGVRKIFV